MTTEKREEEVEEEEWGEKNVEKQKGKEEQGEEGKEETDDTGSLSQTVSDSPACSIPRRLSCNPRCENLEGGRGGGSPSFQEAGGGRETSWEKPSTRLELMENYHT